MARATHRFGFVAALACILAGAAGLVLHFEPAHVAQEVDPTSIQRWGGNAYAMPARLARSGMTAALLEPILSDTSEMPRASRVQLLENGIAIGLPHSIHVEIVAKGRGRFSHWGDTFIFSASDNTDPVRNGRRYALGIPASPVLWLPVTLLVAGFGAAAWCARASGISVRALASGDAMRRASLAASLASIGLAAACALVYAFPPDITHRLDSASIHRVEGHAYSAAVADLLPRGIWGEVLGVAPDVDADPTRSGVRLAEGGKPIGFPHAGHAAIAASGSGRYSHWGDAIVFSATDNTSPVDNGRPYAISYAPAPAPALALSLLLAGLGGLAMLRRTAPAPGSLAERLLQRGAALRPWVFVAGLGTVALFANLGFAQAITAPVLSPDSRTYLEWSALRTIGYPLLIHGYHAAFGTWQYLPLLQLNVLLGSLFVLACALVRVTGSYAVGWGCIALVMGFAGMMASAADMLTEAPFSALVMLHLAFVMLLLDRPRRAFGLLAGLALAAAILVKSVAVVLLGPLLLFVAFLPAVRGTLVRLVLVPAVLGWLLPSAWNLARDGVFESSLAGGYALAGHVAWAIAPLPGSPLAEDARIIQQRLEPVLAKRPATFASWEDYIATTSNEYNTLLWLNIVPSMSKRHAAVCQMAPEGATCVKDSPHCLRAISKDLMRLSREAIAAQPARYAYHVAVHDLGLWKHTFAHGGDFLAQVGARAELLEASWRGMLDRCPTLMGELPALKASVELAPSLASVEVSIARRLVDLATAPGVVKRLEKLLFDHALGVFLLALAACALVAGLARRTPAAQAWCYAALCLNAYFLGTALAQPYLHRYAWTMHGVMAVFLLLAPYLALSAVSWRSTRVRTP